MLQYDGRGRPSLHRLAEFWYPIPSDHLQLEMSMKRILLAFFMAGMVCCFSACGNPRPPEPPALELPKPVRDLRAVRKGNNVSLTWTVPTKTTEAQTIRYLGKTRICRSVDAAMKECGAPIGEASPPELASLVAASKKGTVQSATYADTLPASLPASAKNVMYTVEVLNDNGRSAGLSNQVSVPAVATLPAPSSFEAHLTPLAVSLSWNQVAANVDTPTLQHVYRIYRRDPNGREVVIANLPLDTTQFADHNFEWEKTYQYRAEVVTLERDEHGANCPVEPNDAEGCAPTAIVEGDDTAPVEIFAHDTFPPVVPTGLQAVFTDETQQKFIDLVWAPNSEPDLAGYNIFRHEEGSAPVRINAEIVKTPAYRDTNVHTGKKYFYSISAVDVRGNQSAQSQEAEESVP